MVDTPGAATVLCAAGGETAPVTVSVSPDGGQTWPTRTRVGSGASYPLQMVTSPSFADDRTVWVQTRRGWFISTNAGSSFVVVEAVEQRHQVLAAAYVAADGTPALVTMTPGSAAANAAEYRMVAGTPVVVRGLGATNSYPSLLVLPPTYASGTPARVVGDGFVSRQGDETGILSDGATVRDCTLLTCGAPRFRAGDGEVTTSRGTFTGGQQYLLTGDLLDGTAHVYRGRDWGATWSRWPSLEKLLAPLAGRAKSGIVVPDVTVTAAADQPRRLYALVTNTRAMLDGSMASIAAAERHPAFMLLRSDNDGATWRELGRSYSRVQRVRRTRRLLPWDGVVGEPRLEAARGGSLYLVASARGRTSLFASADAGRTWRRASA